jgi:exosortase H (IPTLxxWG-CTERM-specific)
MQNLSSLPAAAPGKRAALFYALSFSVLALGGVALLLNKSVDRMIVTPFTGFLVDACALVIHTFGGQVAAQGVILAFTDGPGAVAVANGCNAIEVCIVLAAAIAPYPTRLRTRAIGILMCVGMVQAINLGRIISLLYLSRYAPEWFEFAHLYVWDAVIVLDGVLIFFLWTRWADRAHAP